MKFVFEDFSREVDNTEVSVAKKYEKCLEDFYVRVAKIDMKGTASGIYGEIVDAGMAMMEDFFGEGSAREMFRESRSVRKVMTAVCGLNRYMNDIGAVIEEMKGLS